jgi:hypothetical protein
MTFAPDQSVLWNGEACLVVLVRGAMVSLSRERDGFTIITNAEVLAGHQPAIERLPRASLLGGL